MKLLKTVLLSTTFLIGVVSAADLSGVAAQGTSDGSAAEDYIAIVRSSEDFKKKVVGGLLKTITKFTGETAEILSGKGLTPVSEVAPALQALLKMITRITEEKTDIASRLETAAAANAQLIAEKAAAEAALAEAREKLEAVTAEKGVVDGQLAIATAEVTRLTEVLTAETAAAVAAGRDAASSIERLTTELAEAQVQVDDLTAKVDELSALTDTAERLKLEKEAGLRAIEAMNAANNREDGVEDVYDPLAGAEDLPTGMEDDDDYDLRGRFTLLGAFDDDSSAARSSLDDPMTAAAAQIADLKAKRAAAQDAITASPFTGKGSKKKNEDAQAEARATFEDLTDKLEKLGVN